MNLYQHLEEQQKEDFKLLKEYEERLRCAIDPREKRRYSNEIQELKSRISEREAELKSLSKPGLSPQALIEYYLQSGLSEIEPTDIRKIEQALQSTTLDASTLAQGCRLLVKEKGLNSVYSQAKWMYELAVIADGEKPRRHLPVPKISGRSTSVDWMKKLLSHDLPQEYLCKIAQTLGALGVFVPDMIRPLMFLFTNQKYMEADRDEALIYLAMIDMPEVGRFLVQAADLILEQNDSENDYYPSRGLFGLLLFDDINILAEQMLKNPPIHYMSPYAHGLAGSRNVQGQSMLEKMKNHSNQRVRTAIESAFSRPWMSANGNVNLTEVGSSTQEPAKNFFGQFTYKSIAVIALAQEESRRLKYNSVGTEQILLGLIAEGTGIAATILNLKKINLKNARIEVEKLIGHGSDDIGKEIPFTSRAKQLLELSKKEADRLGHNHVCTEHLLLALIKGGGGVGVQVINNLGVNPERLRDSVLKAIVS